MADAKVNSDKSWPTDPVLLPYMMGEKQTAFLLDCTTRTLQRDRMAGTGCPFVKIGKRIFYRRDDVLKYIEERSFASTAESKKASASPGSKALQTPIQPKQLEVTRRSRSAASEVKKARPVGCD